MLFENDWLLHFPCPSWGVHDIGGVLIKNPFHACSKLIALKLCLQQSRNHKEMPFVKDFINQSVSISIQCYTIIHHTLFNGEMTLWIHDMLQLPMCWRPQYIAPWIFLLDHLFFTVIWSWIFIHLQIYKYSINKENFLLMNIFAVIIK